MRLVLWPLAFVVFLVWSFAAWLLFSLSDWAAGLAASLMGGILSAELGPWAQWVSTSLGDILQVVVVVVWALLGLAILTSPVWIGRLRRQHASGPYIYGAAASGSEWRQREDWQGFDRWRESNDDRGRGVRNRDHDDRYDENDRYDETGWRDESRKRRFAGELDLLRQLAFDVKSKYGRKKRKKKWDD